MEGSWARDGRHAVRSSEGRRHAASHRPHLRHDALECLGGGRGEPPPEQVARPAPELTLTGRAALERLGPLDSLLQVLRGLQPGHRLLRVREVEALLELVRALMAAEQPAGHLPQELVYRAQIAARGT